MTREPRRQDNSRGATHCATAPHQAGIETQIERI